LARLTATAYHRTMPDESRMLPKWTPTPDFVRSTNVGRLMARLGCASVADLHRWTVENRADYWELVVRELGVRFRRPYDRVVDLSDGVEAPDWFPGGRLNIVESCFQAADDTPAIIARDESGTDLRWTYADLRRMTARVAAGLRAIGCRPGDAWAIVMPMTPEAVAVYLGVIAAGGVVVGVADSFAPPEIATRLRISAAVGVFTQDVVQRGGKSLPLYAKVMAADAPSAVVLPAREYPSMPLRAGDLAWADFLADDAQLECVERLPGDDTNILFSSGTTGDPKAIPWTQTTPIKAAADAWLHHDIRQGDVLAWPTSLGWMMGPWLIYASLLHRATIALFDGAPGTRAFIDFVGQARVTMLGVVPSLVKAWRAGDMLAGFDPSALRACSSTGECSNPDDMAWLMRQTGGRPIIEYCGGTEIGGGYITGTLAQPQTPGQFSTPAFGLEMLILDDEGRPTDNGEAFLVGPSIGLSTRLLNGDHRAVYYHDTPPGPAGQALRRHGDQIERLSEGAFRAHGRMDDTMNLGGIKASCAEIERVLNAVPGVAETAAIAVPPPGGGPSRLVIYVVRGAAPSPVSTADLAVVLRRAIKEQLNPLFQIHDVVEIDALPRTASNKVMRRVLRARYAEG
jgi:acetyl-CoA synthetase